MMNEQIQELQAEQEPVAWLVDWPNAPELGRYFSTHPTTSNEYVNDEIRIRPLYAAPVQQAEQEPVAWALSHSMGLEFGSKYPMQETKEAAEQMARQHMGAVVVTPLYTAPQPVKLAISEEAFNWIDANAPMFVREALAGVDMSPTEQAEQEPVVRRKEQVNELIKESARLIVSISDEGDRYLTAIDTLRNAYRLGLKDATHVRTKDLTDDELDIFVSEKTMDMRMTLREFARAVIAADREKNK